MSLPIKYIYVSHEHFMPHKLLFKRKKGNSFKPIYHSDEFVSLDTETSKTPDLSEAWLYQWCFSYPAYKNKNVRQLIYGRKPSELAECICSIISMNNMDFYANELSCYVHNLSYDFFYIYDYVYQFCKARYGEKKVDKNNRLLAIDNKKILSWKIMGFTFKCSYRLSQKSLDVWGKELGIKHKKLVGEIDYNVIRYQDSPLYKSDWRYMFRDVIALDECVLLQMDKWSDNMRTIPLTNTGYVRRYTRAEFNKDSKNRLDFKKKALDYPRFKALNDEFSGGLTHGNRYHAGKTVTILKGKYKGCYIKHRDFRSHYPTQQRCKPAPASAFKLYFSVSQNHKMRLDELFKLSEKRCILASIIISELEVKKGVTLPVAQASKFQLGRIGKTKLSMIEDNGRILKMKSGASLITVNEYDLKWLHKQYNFNYLIVRVYTAKRGKYPEYLQNTVDNFYYGKTSYKDKEHDIEAEGFNEVSIEWIANHLDLMINKGMLNSIYGMTATNPIRTEYKIDKNGEWYHEKYTPEQIESKLKSFYESETSFMNYELGCWTTAEARDELLTMYELICNNSKLGSMAFLYADTDSIFYISDDELEEKIEAVNKEWMEEADRNGWFIECNGRRVHYHQFELEKEEITSFRFLHAKCYAYTTVKDGKESLHATIAGVKRMGRNNNNRIKELKDINNLENGYKFYDCGGTTCEYINRRPDIIEIDGHVLEVASAAIIKDTIKTLKHEIEKEDNIMEGLF